MLPSKGAKHPRFYLTYEEWKQTSSHLAILSMDSFYLTYEEWKQEVLTN